VIRTDSGTAFRFGAGRPCLDFIRTLRHRGRPGQSEELPDGTALRAWIIQAGLSAPDTMPSQAEVAEARQLREAIAELLVAARGPAGPAGCPPVARGRVNHAAAAAPPVPSLDARGQLCHGAGNPVQAALSWLARDALDLVTSPALTRLKNCANPDCRIIFLDSSRPGARRWCSMGTCGNQSKKRAYDAKRQLREAAASPD
jgi:predicted RNA-binding Zn ribbon-like protein